MKEALEVQLTKELLDKINPKEIIYAEYASIGAMGNAGGVIIYIIIDNTLLCCEESMVTNEAIFEQAVDSILEHQDKLKFDHIVFKENLFDCFYGGMGNNVFVNKDVSLEIGDGHFIYKKDNVEYKILPSVQGVFESVADLMRDPSTNGYLARIGLSIEDAIIVESVEEEYESLGNICSKCIFIEQVLVFENKKPHHILRYLKPNGEDISFYFDISNFFEKEL